MRPYIVVVAVGVLLFVACRPAPGKPPLPTTPGQVIPMAPVTPRAAPPSVPHQATPALTPLTALATPAPMIQPTPDGNGEPTLADFWAGRAHFVIDVPDTGLPMGESDTIVMRNGELWSYLHASHPSAGVVDQCGAPVDFPGCVIIMRSVDGGVSFTPLEDPPVCQIACNQCPCQADVDHTRQQQYPRVQYVEDESGGRLWMVYEYQGRVMVRHSTLGLEWSPPQHVADSLIWHLWYANCPAEERIGQHPFVPFDYECLRGGPPGLFIDGTTMYIFMAQGQNPGAMGCFKRRVDAEGAPFDACAANPLFVGAPEYGPREETGPVTNAYFDFRTISSAEVMKLNAGDAARFYMLYEGVRGPGPGDAGDSQFALGLARSQGARIDGPWEKYSGNPILVDLPGNVGLGHADLVVLEGRTFLYTSLDGVTRSRLVLVWDE